MIPPILLARAVAIGALSLRAPDDPRRPPDYGPLDEFWTKRQYRPLKGVTATYSWTEIGDGEAETDHMLQFWMRDL